MASFSLSIDTIALAIHIISALAAFGTMLAYPVIVTVVNRTVDPQSRPLFHRTQVQIIRRLVNPGVIVVVASGLVIAFDTATLSDFYVKWGLLAAIALGAIAEGYLAPREAQLAELAASDLRGRGSSPSSDYDNLSRQVGRVTYLASGIVLATIVVMVAHT